MKRQDPNQILVGDVLDRLQELPAGSVQCCVTSPPYWGLRDYGVEGQLGLEKAPQEFLANMVEVFRGVRRVLRDDGTLWLNIGDSYARHGGWSNNNGLDGVSREESNRARTNAPEGVASQKLAQGLKGKDLCLIPERLAIALQDDGWWIRSRIAWCKKSSMPESVTDRPTSAWEHIWLLTKSARYYYDAEAVKAPPNNSNPTSSAEYRKSVGRGSGNAELGRGDFEDGGQRSKAIGNSATGANLRNYWILGPEPYPEAHFATFPSEIPRRCIKAGTSQKGACSECGAPWGRIVEKDGGTWEQRKADGHAMRYGMDAINERDGVHLGGSTATTTGWQPTCACDAEVVPCTVLDPFLGSGTTAAVAQELDREWVGIELNPEYAALAEKRINAVGASQIGLAI